MLTFGVLWFREHNRHAKRLAKVHTNWTDEKIFNRARQWTIAEHQVTDVYLLICYVIQLGYSMLQ